MCELEVCHQRVNNTYAIMTNRWNCRADNLKYMWRHVDVNSTKDSRGGVAGSGCVVTYGGRKAHDLEHMAGSLRNMIHNYLYLSLI